MFDVTQPTPLDLRWRMFGIPIRVHPLFWLITLLMGPLNQNLIYWVPIVFVSILLHELGHAFLAKVFRWYPSVLLYSFGGLCFHDPHPQAPGKRILVLLCGPFAQFLLAGAVYLYILASGWSEHPQLELVIDYLLYVNVGWAAMNLLPVYPLDGGQISRILLALVAPRGGGRAADVLSIVVAVGVAIAGWYFGYKYVGLLFALLALETILRLRQQGGFVRGPDQGSGYRQ